MTSLRHLRGVVAGGVLTRDRLAKMASGRRSATVSLTLSRSKRRQVSPCLALFRPKSHCSPSQFPLDDAR